MTITPTMTAESPKINRIKPKKAANPLSGGPAGWNRPTSALGGSNFRHRKNPTKAKIDPPAIKPMPRSIS